MTVPSVPNSRRKWNSSSKGTTSPRALPGSPKAASPIRVQRPLLRRLQHVSPVATITSTAFSLCNYRHGNAPSRPQGRLASRRLKLLCLRMSCFGHRSIQSPGVTWVMLRLLSTQKTSSRHRLCRVVLRISLQLARTTQISRRAPKQRFRPPPPPGKPLGSRATPQEAQNHHAFQYPRSASCPIAQMSQLRLMGASQNILVNSEPP
mmetsp:Transcript_67649/g.78550  ORF Transcript_67649/g.78550 Transcript_67649/m.78550 type:complete len:206 (-) Transcript_67649:204-821(-)